MKTYILTVDPVLFDRNSPIFAKVGKPTEFHEFVVVETSASINTVRTVPGVKSVVEDFQHDIDSNVVESDWGAKYLGKKINNSFNGEGVDVYLIDSGVRSTHAEFKDNKIVHMWSIDDLQYGTSLSPNHGTACCSMILGIAPKATVYSLRANFMSSGILKSLDMIAAAHKNGKNNSVVSMSFSSTLDMYDGIVTRLRDIGVIMVGSAGNSSSPTPKYPAARPEVFSVGAIDQLGNIAHFSSGAKSGNDFWAPGVNLKAPSIESDTAYSTFNGTSAATPLIAGVAACALTGSDKITSSEGVEWLKHQLSRNRHVNKTYPGDGVVPLATGFKEMYSSPVTIPPPVVEEPMPTPPVEPEPPTPIPEPPVVPAPPPEEKEEKKDKTPIIAGAIAGVVLAGILVYHFFIAG